MKTFDKLLIAAVALVALIFVGANLLLHLPEEGDEGRPYRVEIARLALAIEEKGLDAVELDGCIYVTHIEQAGEGDLYASDSDYIIREIDGVLYRFDYTPDKSELSTVTVTVNILLGVIATAMLSLLLYIRQKLLRPFETLTELPYELSKGNLTVPIKANKNKFFGRFVWGVDLLREKMEEQKAHELELQKERKTLLLSLSHDIKTPLSAIKLYSKALSKGLYTDKDKQLEIAESINAKADEIEGYVSQIVSASREDFLSLEVTMGEFYLSELVHTVGGYYGEKLALVKTAFTIGAYTNCLLKGDLDRSVEVMQNIIENAIKYGDGAQISLDFAEEEGCILVSVRNSGCTLPDTELPHIFDSFWRGSNAASVKGSGLGLYICRSLMHKMNGEIFAAVKDGQMSVTAVFNKA